MKHDDDNMPMPPFMRGLLIGTANGVVWTAALAAILALTGCGTIASHETPDKLVVDFDAGGLIDPAAENMRALEASGKRVEIRGTLHSAGIMYLGLSNVCIHPKAKVAAHGASSWWSFGLHPRTDGDAKMALGLPESEFREWFWNEGRHLRGILGTTFTGQEIHDKAGVELCD